ncbi:uncharacterized protein UV8b_07797 [Ustilaginoidea virens]|uniref:Uncharacterized protein n=1 Tax=Ustilaginoidea virens TaxID=1159556 RepID=A0A8E5ML51_USTVR|nr:uncharacterized protein UV8b_07797 [Ustilaginoidea virens]QUC23556.1 hypothetical protein UV8b_07797 [Ustilaginoidea virens]
MTLSFMRHSAGDRSWSQRDATRPARPDADDLIYPSACETRGNGLELFRCMHGRVRRRRRRRRR